MSRVTDFLEKLKTTGVVKSYDVDKKEIILADGISEEDFAAAYKFILMSEWEEYAAKNASNWINSITNDPVKKKKLQEAFLVFGVPIPGPGGGGGGSNSEEDEDSLTNSVCQNNQSKASSNPNSAANQASASNALAKTVQEILENLKSIGMTPGATRNLNIRRPEQRPTIIQHLRLFSNAYHIGDTHKTFFPPDKKKTQMFGGKMIFPTDAAEEIEVAIIIDTSGSMSEKDLEKAGMLIAGVMHTFTDGHFRIFWNDAEEFREDEYDGYRLAQFIEEIKKKGIHGGGGSIFNKVLNDRKVRTSDVIVLVSDFYIIVDKVKPSNTPILFVPTKDYDQGTLNELKKKYRRHYVVELNKVFL